MRAVVIGTGPSLTATDCKLVKEWRFRHHQRDPHRIVIAVNDAYMHSPWADHLYACDFGWWQYSYTLMRESCKAMLWSINESPRGLYGTRTLYDGGNRDHGSGMQAVRLAEHLGATDVALLGFDWGLGEDETLHAGPDYPEPLCNVNDYANAVEYKFKMPVTNCSRHTHLTWYPRKPLTDWLVAA